MSSVIRGSDNFDSLESKGLGSGQTWQAAELTNTGAVFTDGTPSYRANGVTYTNNTGRPIMVHARGDTQNGSLGITVDGLAMLSTYIGNNLNVGIQHQILVPPGSTYVITGTTLIFVRELR